MTSDAGCRINFFPTRQLFFANWSDGLIILIFQFFSQPFLNLNHMLHVPAICIASFRIFVVVASFSIFIIVCICSCEFDWFFFVLLS